MPLAPNTWPRNTFARCAALQRLRRRHLRSSSCVKLILTITEIAHFTSVWLAHTTHLVCKNLRERQTSRRLRADCSISPELRRLQNVVCQPERSWSTRRASSRTTTVCAAAGTGGFLPSRSCVRISRRLRIAVTPHHLVHGMNRGENPDTIRHLCNHTSLRRKRFSTLRLQNRTGEFVTLEPRDEASSTVTDDDFVRQADTGRCHSACTSRTVKSTVVQRSALMQ